MYIRIITTLTRMELKSSNKVKDFPVKLFDITNKSHFPGEKKQKLKESLDFF